MTRALGRGRRAAGGRVGPKTFAPAYTRAVPEHPPSSQSFSSQTPTSSVDQSPDAEVLDDLEHRARVLRPEEAVGGLAARVAQDRLAAWRRRAGRARSAAASAHGGSLGCPAAAAEAVGGAGGVRANKRGKRKKDCTAWRSSQRARTRVLQHVACDVVHPPLLGCLVLQYDPDVVRAVVLLDVRPAGRERGWGGKEKRRCAVGGGGGRQPGSGGTGRAGGRPSAADAATRRRGTGGYIPAACGRNALATGARAARQRRRPPESLFFPSAPAHSSARTACSCRCASAPCAPRPSSCRRGTAGRRPARRPAPRRGRARSHFVRPFSVLYFSCVLTGAPHNRARMESEGRWCGRWRPARGRRLWRGGIGSGACSARRRRRL